MAEGVLDALEAQVISGSGAGENMTGIPNVAGTRVVAFATDVTTTLRKAFTLMQTNREPPNTVVLHPAGDCFDNAAMESFWARMQVELLNTRRCATTIELAAAMADYIDNFYNVERRHSYLGNISPTEFETLWTSTYSIPQLA
jgi:transposase InsO family protein